MVLALIFMVGMQENGQAVSYVKRFEKSAAVCTHGENFLKKDQSDREPWELDPRNLGGIVWEKKKAISEGLDMEAAAFDLDNNGDKEILVKLNSWGPHGYRKIESLTIIRGPDLSPWMIYGKMRMSSQQTVILVNPRASAMISRSSPRIFRGSQLWCMGLIGLTIMSTSHRSRLKGLAIWQLRIMVAATL